MSSPTPKAIVDTVVLRYFLFVDRAQLLLDLLGAPIGVPRPVFDPDEGAVPEEAMSEVPRSIVFQQRRSADPRRSQDARNDAALKAARLTKISDLHAAGSVLVIDMTEDERLLFGRLMDREGAAEFGLRIPLGMGEAACVAIAVGRQWLLSTDDTDALRALAQLKSAAEKMRIRALLREAATLSIVTPEEANGIHGDMRRMGFWDTTPPFK